MEHDVGKHVSHVSHVQYDTHDHDTTTTTTTSMHDYHAYNDLPSMVRRTPNGHVIYTAWHDHGRLHRVHGPAVQEFTLTSDTRNQGKYYN